MINGWSTKIAENVLSKINDNTIQNLKKEHSFSTK
jgi:hypothetical protein